MRVLDDTNTWSLIRPGHESSTWSVQFIRRWGLVRESVPGATHWWWDSLDGKTFLGRLWMVFFLDGAGRRRESTRVRSTGSVFDGRHTFLCLLNSPNFYVIYYMLSSGSFAVTSSSTDWRQWRAASPRSYSSVTDSTEQWVNVSVRRGSGAPSTDDPGSWQNCGDSILWQHCPTSLKTWPESLIVWKRDRVHTYMCMENPGISV